MLRQVTLLKVKADAPPGKIDEIADELRNLGSKVPEVKRPHVAILTDNPSWDVLFIWEFENREAHQRYVRHPFHGPMDRRIRPYFESITTVRYDFKPDREFERKGDSP